MEWIKFKDKWPQEWSQVIYYDSINDTTAYCLFHFKKGEKCLHSHGYYCNVAPVDEFGDRESECDEINNEDCGCDIVVNPEDSWLQLPDKPKE